MVYEWGTAVDALSREAKARLMSPTDMETDQQMLASVLGVEYDPMKVDLAFNPFLGVYQSIQPLSIK